MIAISGKKLCLASFLALAAILGAANLHAQSCNYYVSTIGTDFTMYDPNNSTRGETVATVFASLQGAHNYIAASPSQSNLGSQPITICVESGERLLCRVWGSGPYPNTMPGFDEPFIQGQVVTEQILDPGYVDPTASQPDLRVTNSTVLANGCANGNMPCFAPGTDILGVPRTYPYASGAYATSSQ